MSRLTEKNELPDVTNLIEPQFGYHIKADIEEDAIAQKWNYYDSIDKLGQLEDILESHNIETLVELDDLLCHVKKIKDIEESLGIDLITLFKALRSGIHIIDDGYPYNDRVKLIYSSGTPCGFKGNVSDHCVFFKDYGKTWSLTKKELL